MRRAKIQCSDLTDEVFSAYSKGNHKELGIFSCWDIAVHFRQCAGCSSRYLGWRESRREANPWVGADPVVLVARRKS